MIIINFYTNYLYTVTVDSVGMGCVSAEGKTLRLIGNFPVQPGDVVFTDGRIAYGHAPKKPQVLNSENTKGIPHTCDSSTYNGAINLSGTKINKVNSYTDFRTNPSNWCYTTPQNFYCYSMNSSNPSAQKFDNDDSSFYLDMLVQRPTNRSSGVVWTAEFTNSDIPYMGKNANPAGNFAHTSFLATNFYFTESSGYSPESGGFDFNWFESDFPNPGDGGRLYANCGIRIRRNGRQTQMIDLSNYQLAIDQLQQIYCNNDTLDSAIEKRYHCVKSVPRGYEKFYSFDIFVSYSVVQCLHFHFTDTDGNWEAILFTMCEGMPSPHTIDQEYNKEKGEYEDIHSVFSMAVPQVWYVVRVNSSGRQEILQHNIIVNSYTKNLVDYKDWVNAINYPVEPYSSKSSGKFWINYGDCSIETDLRVIYTLKYGNRSIRANGFYPRTFNYIIGTDYTRINPYGGANNAWISYDLRHNDAEYHMAAGSSPGNYGFMSGNSMFQYGMMRDRRINRCYLFGEGTSYLGRLSVLYKAGKYFFTLYNNQIYVTTSDGSEILQTSPYNFNMNVEILNNVRKLKRPRTINDLVADMTRPINNNDSS